MPKGPKAIIASLLAPIASLSVPAILAIVTILTDTSLQSGDAPLRAAGLVLIAVVPIAYPVLAIVMAVVGYTLKRIHKLSLRNLLCAYGLLGIPAAGGLGW